jgi:predicted flap endonuclease-1-like 5' DNA nuclease
MLTGLAAFLTLLLRQKNTAIELAQARLARMEQRMSQLANPTAESTGDGALQAQLAAQRAEIARLTALAATLQGEAESAAPIATRQASLALVQDAWQQRFVAEAGWQEKAPALAAVGRALEILPPSKLRYATQAVQARIVPEIVAQPQDLSAVSGIGAIYEQRLYNAGIGTYWELATLDDDVLRRILKLDKVRVAATDLDAIRASARSLAQEQATAGYIWNGESVDDFEPIHGIGKVYEQRLYNAGIRTYAALAQSSPDQLLEIVQARSPVPPDVASWIEQAGKLADAHSAA